MDGPLPIDPVLPEVLERLRSAGRLVLEAPPGAGKTTRVPAALLDAGLAGDGEVVVLEPRRLAARLAARHVAASRGGRVGDEVGYRVRHEDACGPRTRLLYVTERILGRRLLEDPTLARVGCVVLDEFHERHLAGDVALAALARLRATRRPDLRLLVASATLDAEPVARFLGDCPRVRSEGRAHPVAIEYLPPRGDRPLAEEVASAVRRLVAEGLDGDVLAFLPGAGEIRRAGEACREVAARADLLVVALHGDLPPERQDEAVRPAARRKVVLSTNVAETSVTIEGVAAVIDTGLARRAGFRPWSGLPVLAVEKVSRASAAQRAGRAGRTRDGRCLRLYARSDHDARPAFDVPEVRRADLAETVLELRALGEEPGRFPWFEAPDPTALDAADALLRALGAVDRAGGVTDLGRDLLRMPLHPRLGRLVAAAEREGIGDLGVEAAALLSERDLRLAARARGIAAATGSGAGDTGPSDVLGLLDALAEARRLRFEPARLSAAGIDPAAARAVERARRQIAGLRRGGAPRGPRASDEEAALGLAVLAAWPDRVARRRRPGRPEVLLSGGGAAVLDPGSVVRDAEFLVAVDAEAAPRGDPRVRIASAVEPEWLLERHPERVSEATVATWNEEAERAEGTRRLCYDALVLEERRVADAASPEVAALLAERAAAAGPRAFADPEALDRLLARAALVAATFPDRGFPALSEDDARAALAGLAAGRASFEEVRRADLLAATAARLAPGDRRFLDAMAPERVALPGGRSVRVEYAAGRPPWIATSLQDLFGSASGPAVCDGRVTVVLHLLAPNRRAVQVTTDLVGFWERHYPAVRRELSRRYPRHAWPEDPRAAAPPAPRGRRPRRA